MIRHIDAIHLLKELPDNSIDLIFTDPPYALGSEVIIRENGKPDYKKAIDFMNKWDQPDGKFWEEWFKEANRVLKYGGRVLMFGMDRQLMLNKYYGTFAGLHEQQSLYWYFASSMPKAVDLSKMLDKHFGEEREVIRKYKLSNGQEWNLKQVDDSNIEGSGAAFTSSARRTLDISKGSHYLAKKYEGLKYSIVPTKQTNETIMVFQKPYKTKSCLHDTLAYENGDLECCCGAIDVDGNRIPHDEPVKITNRNVRNDVPTFSNKTSGFKNENDNMASANESGRFPSQTFVDSETAKMLDEQSGQKTSGAMKPHHNVGKTGEDGFMPHHGIYGKYKAQPFGKEVEASVGGCSKILHKCDYDEKDIELYYYASKVDKKERNIGLDNFPIIKREVRGNNQAVRYCSDCNKTFNDINDHSNCVGELEYRQSADMKNNHPTVKPISLLLKILNLFKTPNPQVCVDTFAGSGSIPIAAKLLGFEVIAGDLDEGFVGIANARLDYAIKHPIDVIKIIGGKLNKIDINKTNHNFF